jgi:hypothetical protein
MAPKAPKATSPTHSALAGGSQLSPAGGCTVNTLLYLNSRTALIATIIMIIIHSCNRGILGFIVIVSIVSSSSSPARPHCEGPLQMTAMMTAMMREQRHLDATCQHQWMGSAGTEVKPQ